ncbi:predicted protein [Pyrenophora tritici-repentis Pt-1C-BFP]|uniref:Uncharacterized protein n=1 Tax=Pyrenophora tritici-repentis (strain Pt-1C-BFP) TaxID=426418 RepID=B2VVL7_PYRTR|nr:uncharacterized protein PTRG_01229 [Pyrenophora tritici-repentis Pt-1C-BFP]EDU40667.1 predicted protein [Pyrenophora tritici-repentis Pt-1C-BFP]
METFDLNSLFGVRRCFKLSDCVQTGLVLLKPIASAVFRRLQGDTIVKSRVRRANLGRCQCVAAPEAVAPTAVHGGHGDLLSNFGVLSPMYLMMALFLRRGGGCRWG